MPAQPAASSLLAQMTPMHAPVQMVPNSPVQMVPPPPMDEDDPFARFGEPLQQGTCEPTRPGIFLPGLEASRRMEESKASSQPPRVPVFGGSGGNIPKLFAEKMAGQAEAAKHAEALGALGEGSSFQEGEALLEAARLGHVMDTVRIEYLSPTPPMFPEEGEAAQREPSFLRAEPLLWPEAGGLEMSATVSERKVSPEFLAQEFPPLPSEQEAAEQGALASLLSAASEDIAQNKSAGEHKKEDESDIRRAFVQSKTQAKSPKGLRRFLIGLAVLLVLMLLLPGIVILRKEGELFNPKPDGSIDWGKSFSWERLKRNLFSEAAAKEKAGGLYAMQGELQAFGVEEALK